tara:strand:+ start:420 stop:836 length:417 start_codon:yes stop_codon:yes gene_type:complete
MVVPPSPLPGIYVIVSDWARMSRLRSFSICAQKFENLKKLPHHIVIDVGYLERVKDFFKKPPEHNLKVGDLVTCTCHGGVAVVVALYDASERVEDPHVEYPRMNMAKIWWINTAHQDQERSWIHTIGRLSKYGEHWPE